MANPHRISALFSAREILMVPAKKDFNIALKLTWIKPGREPI
jgi:hypothetical protein